MRESQTRAQTVISEQVMLERIAQSEQMREFFIQMWLQNPELAKQGGARVQSLLTRLERVEPEAKAAASSSAGLAKQRGISLIELIMFIVIVSVSLAGILTVMNLVTRSSADPLVHKQALAIAESLMEEVQLMPFTFCDIDDPNMGSAVTAANCTGGAGGPNDESAAIGPETAASVGGAEGRDGAPQFDNVSDYNAFPFVPGAVVDINGTAAPAGYTAAIAIALPPAALGVVPVADTLLITVTVTGPDGVPIRLDGYRTRYAPNN